MQNLQTLPAGFASATQCSQASLRSNKGGKIPLSIKKVKVVCMLKKEAEPPHSWCGDDSVFLKEVNISHYVCFKVITSNINVPCRYGHCCYHTLHENLEIKIPLIWAFSQNFPLIISAIPPGNVKNKPMQHETIHISMCTLAEQKLRAEHFLSLSGKQSFPAPAGGRHLCAVQGSYGKQAILSIDSPQKR